MTLENAQSKIRNAWIAGLVSTFMTLGATVYVLTGRPFLNFSIWNFLDVLLLLILTFGIYQKSRLAAVLMLVYFLASRILTWFTLPPSIISLVVSAIFVYVYFEGIRGTMAYHGLIR